MIKKISVKMLGATVLFGSLLSTTAQADWKGWNIHSTGYPLTVAIESFIDNVDKATDGRVSGRVYNGAVLGNQSDAIQMMQIGGIEFAGFSMGPMGTAIPEVNVLSLPFIFKNVDHMYRVMDGPFADRLNEAMAKYGIIALGYYDAGSRSFYNNSKPIVEPNDVADMKFRVMNNELYVNMVAALGGNGTPMAFSEVYQSLKTGVVDGAENNEPSYESTNHYEVAKYYSETQHLIIPECLCVSVKAWEKVSDADKEIVKAEAKKSVAMQRKLWKERVQASRDLIAKAGVKFNQVADKQAFSDAMKPVYEQAVKAQPVLASYIKQIQETE